jgi:hypothetical protein
MTTLAAPHPKQLARLAPRLIPGFVVLTLSGVILCATLARLENFANPPATPPSARSVKVSSALAILRMTLRLLAAARLRQHIGQEKPFTLTEFAGGRMRLADPTTGLSVELEAFGPSNVGEFTYLLTPATGS